MLDRTDPLKDKSGFGINLDKRSCYYEWCILLCPPFSPMFWEISYSNKRFGPSNVITRKDVEEILACDDVTTFKSHI